MMINPTTAKAIQEFQKLTIEEQKKKLTTMITIFAHTAPVWKETLELIEKDTNVDLEFTTNIYQSIMEYGDELEQGNKEKAMQAIQKTSDYLAKLKDVEASEKVQEEQELDSMLDEIENL